MLCGSNCKYTWCRADSAAHTCHRLSYYDSLCGPPVSAWLLLNVTAETLLEALHGTRLNSFRKKELLRCLRRCSFWIFTKQQTMLSIPFVFLQTLRKNSGKVPLITAWLYALHPLQLIRHSALVTFDVKCHRTWHTDSVVQFRNIASRIWCMEVWWKMLNIHILVYNSNKIHMSQSLFYLITVLHVLGFTITHPQEHKTTVTTASGNHYTVLLSAAIHDSNRQQYGVMVTRCCSYSCFVLLRMGDSDARNM
jgi:hypothetical protein